MQSQVYQEGFQAFMSAAALTRDYFECEPPYEHGSVEFRQYVQGWEAAEAAEQA